MSIALRTLSPDLLVCDEIGGEEEAAAVADSLDAGVALLCSAHAGSAEQLRRRRPLRMSGVRPNDVRNSASSIASHRSGGNDKGSNSGSNAG